MSQLPAGQHQRPLHIGPARLVAPETRSGKAKLHQKASHPSPIRLENRDLQVLEALATHRFLSGHQIHRLFFRCGGSMVRRRLRALYDHDFIDRVAIVGQPTRGFPPFLYVLGKSGVAALTEHGVACSAEAIGSAKAAQVRHRYLVNETYVTLIEAVRDTPNSIHSWQPEEALLLRRDEGRGNAEQVTDPRLGRPSPFMPDAFFELQVGTGESYAFFLEIDLATHAQRVWRHRARLYAVYADPQRGLFRQRFGRETFRLLIVTTPDYRGRSRRDNILASIRRELGPTDMFLATTIPELQPDRVLGPIWRRADGTTITHSMLPSVRVQTSIGRGQSAAAPLRIQRGPA